MTKAIIIAHYHSHGLVRDDTLELIQELERIYDRIIFVSTHLLETEKSKFSDKVEIFVRENIGYDFYSYRFGLLHLKSDAIFWDQLKHLSIMNTSFMCFAPSKLIDQYFKVLEQEKFEAIGFMKSSIIQTHLQSFLLSLSPKVLQLNKFLDWWENIKPISDRAQVILQLEIGFSQILRQSHISLKGVYQRPLTIRILNALKAGPYKLLKILKIRPYKKIRNLMFADYLEIYERFGIVKIELLKKNTFDQDIGEFVEHLQASPREKQLYQQALNN